MGTSFAKNSLKVENNHSNSQRASNSSVCDLQTFWIQRSPIGILGILWTTILICWSHSANVLPPLIDSLPSRTLRNSCIIWLIWQSNARVFLLSRLVDIRLGKFWLQIGAGSWKGPRSLQIKSALGFVCVCSLQTIFPFLYFYFG
jgi:hypothetical protein